MISKTLKKKISGILIYPIDNPKKQMIFDDWDDIDIFWETVENLMDELKIKPEILKYPVCCNTFFAKYNLSDKDLKVICMMEKLK